MKLSTKILSLFAATLVALVSSARAQVVTSETVSAWNGNVIVFQGHATMGETFSNVLQVSSMTYTFLSASNSSAAGNLQATFGEWNTGTNTFNTTLDLGIITIPTSSTWTSTLERNSTTYYSYNLPFNLGISTDASKTYALMFTNTSGTATSFGLGRVDGNPFAFGSAFDETGTKDWAFSQIAIVPNGNDLPPTPESSTVAAILGCGLVAGLVGFRLRQQRQMVLAPISQAAV